MNDNEILEKEILPTCKQVIIGAILKFESIDAVDFRLLIDDFEKKTNIQMDSIWCETWPFGRFIHSRNGAFSLRDDLSFNYFIKGENCTLREHLQKMQGNIVNNYFNNLDVKVYMQEKKKALLENKEKVLTKANVLLISDIQEDCDELLKYGFHNVDYFKSIVRANSYFEKHPAELGKYHIILNGHHNFNDYSDLWTKDGGLKAGYSIIDTTFRHYDYFNHIESVVYLRDIKNWREWRTVESSYKDVFDRIVENTFINHTMEKVILKNQEFQSIQDNINPNRLPLPIKKSELKILYLAPVHVHKSGFADKIAKTLGLNITFKEDNNYSLDRHIKNNLGNYDIIIASHYSSNILSMSNESTEQCKDTGRDLTMLLTYDDLHSEIDRDLGDGIILKYVFGGSAAPSSEYHNKKVRILRQPVEVHAESRYFYKCMQSQYSKMEAIIESSVNFYNQALIQIGKSAISDLDLKPAEEYEQEYVNAFENKLAKEEAELAPIKEFDSIRYAVMRYLENRKKGFTHRNPEGLRITEEKDGIKVENTFSGRILCTIVFSKKNNEQKNLRVFDIQTLSKKGNLTPPQTIGVYTSQYETLAGIPSRPDEKQAGAITSIQKKVNHVLEPINEEVESLLRNYIQHTKKQETKTYSKYKK